MINPRRSQTNLLRCKTLSIIYYPRSHDTNSKPYSKGRVVKLSQSIRVGYHNLKNSVYQKDRMKLMDR